MKNSVFVESVTDESGTEYRVKAYIGGARLYGDWTQSEAKAQKYADAIEQVCDGLPVLATEADCIAADLANLRYKQSGGPAKDNQARAIKLEQQWSEAARLGGMLS